MSLIGKKMRERYQTNKGLDRSKIDAAFNASTKSDQQWVESQVRKEQYGDSKKSRWQKPAWKKY